MDESAKERYYIILGRYLLTAAVLNLKFPDSVIEVDDGTFKGYTEPMVDMDKYEFKDLNTGGFTP